MRVRQDLGAPFMISKTSSESVQLQVPVRASSFLMT
jgi:hypothetical protein